jgi:hypothetical protein
MHRPLPERAALPAPRAAPVELAITEAAHDELGQVAGRVSPAARAPAAQRVPVLEDLSDLRFACSCRRMAKRGFRRVRRGISRHVLGV